MREYRSHSKVFILISVLGIVLTVINMFTGIINPVVQSNRGSSIICIAGFALAGILTVFQERARIANNEK